jgi:hypothetical protein
LVIAIGAIEQCLLTWASRDAHGVCLIPVKGCNPLRLIWQALRQCPDEYPSPSTADLQFIPDQELRDSIRRDAGAASQALHNGEWKAATVLAGAAIEALLYWRLGQLSPTEQANGVSTAMSQGKLKQKPPTDLDDWTLQHFIEVAGVLNLIEADTVKAANLARDFRNLIHPGRATRLASECNRATALSALAGLEHVINYLS